MAELFWPFDPAIINYGFGYPPGYGGFHNGIDFPVPQGTELRATVSGTIRNNDAGWTDGAGVDITTPDGWMVRMWHVSKFLVPHNSWVNAGDAVALSGGQPGTWGAGNATGPHLHWGTMVNGNWVDPASLNPKRFNSGSATIGNEMYLVKTTDGRGLLVREWDIQHIQDPGEFDTLSRILASNPKDPDTFVSNQIDAVSKYLTPQKVQIPNIQINVDQIAQAIADKIDCGGGVDVTTKAEILEAIELNYPGDK